MAIGGFTGGSVGRSQRSAISDAARGNNPGGGTGTGRPRPRPKPKAALPPPPSLTTRPPVDRDKGPLQKAIESVLPSGDSPGMFLGITPTIGNFLRQQATRAGLSIGPSTPGIGPSNLLGVGVGGDEDTQRLLGEAALPAGDAPVAPTATPEDDMEQTNLAPTRTRLTLPNIRRRRLQSATFFG